MKATYKIQKSNLKLSRKPELTHHKKSSIPALFFLVVLFFFLIAETLAETNGKIRVSTSFDGFILPVHAVFPSNLHNTLYVVEQKGKIIRIKDEKRSLFLDITDNISSGGELGLLSMALPASFRENNGDVFYINYTTKKPYHTIIAEIPVKKSAGTIAADFSHMRVVLKFPQPFSNHNGGLILFGPDKYLYIGTGDGGSAGDPSNNAQNPQSLLGKILKINPEKFGSKSYGIPQDAPAILGALPEIYAMGFRNPWRFSFDKNTGNLFAGDVGQNKMEEIDFITKGGNYGWRVMEGNLCYNSENCQKSPFVRPIYAYGRGDGISVTGGYVYRGQKIPELYGKYIFADFGSGHVWSLPLDASGKKVLGKASLILENAGRISSFAEDQAGELYLIDYSGGNILKME